MAIEQIAVGNAPDDKMTVTLRGEATELVQVLVHGLPREALLALFDAINEELSARKTKERHE